MEQVYTPKQNYKVLVNCITYNQSKYIEDALNGFAMQKTDFPFACLVMDDASTDGEQDVIKAWMERECDMERAENVEIEKSFVTIVPHKTNSSCTFAFYFLKENLYKKGGKIPMIAPWREHCEYEALCEGDDYWIYPRKLQRQVEWLDYHNDYILVCSNAKIVSEEGELDWSRYEVDSDIDANMMITGTGGYVQTASLVYRVGVLENYPDYCKNCCVGDYPLQIWCNVNGRVRYFYEKMVVYRNKSAGSWSSNQSYLDYEQKLCQVKSIISMLSGINKFTHSKYRNSIDRAMIYQITTLYRYRKGWKVLAELEREIQEMRLRNKIRLTLSIFSFFLKTTT